MTYTSDHSSSPLANFERIKLLGKGSFGRAWKVRHKTSGVIYVAKDIKCANKQDLDDALMEASVLRRVEHIFIVGYTEVFRTSAKLVTIVMEFCGGGDVGEKIARRKFRNQFFDEHEVQIWLVQLLEALRYLHNKGILHRDIKNGNIFLTETNIAKLGDFGIARVLDRNAPAPLERTTKTPVGTPMNMSPEICRGDRYNFTADIWALGCSFYEMCSLRPAFMAYDMKSLVAKIKRGHHDRFLPKHYSADSAKLIAAMLKLDPASRPTADELLKAPCLHACRRKVAEIMACGAAPPVADPIESLSKQPNILVVEETYKQAQPVAHPHAHADAGPHRVLLTRPQLASPGVSPQSSPRVGRKKKSSPGANLIHLLEDAGALQPHSSMSKRHHSDPEIVANQRKDPRYLSVVEKKKRWSLPGTPDSQPTNSALPQHKRSPHAGVRLKALDYSPSPPRKDVTTGPQAGYLAQHYSRFK